jgi:hypothetical protein
MEGCRRTEACIPNVTDQEKSMDQQHFDHLTTTLARPESRRSAARFLGAAALGALGVSVLGTGRSEARRRKKKGGRCLKSGDLCDTDKQCCGNGLICEVPQNASNSDHRCCGAQGAVCGGVNEDGDFQPPFCCIGEAGVRSFICSASDPGNPGVRGTCIPNPSED